MKSMPNCPSAKISRPIITSWNITQFFDHDFPWFDHVAALEANRAYREAGFPCSRANYIEFFGATQAETEALG